MEKLIGRGASGRGEDRTSSMARLRCFFPIYPLGHNVSDTSSTGITNGDSVDDDENENENDALLLRMILVNEVLDMVAAALEPIALSE